MSNHLCFIDSNIWLYYLIVDSSSSVAEEFRKRSLALSVNASILYSEDMQDNMVIEQKLTIINPLK